MIKNIIFDIGNVMNDFGWKEWLKSKGYDDEMVKRISDASINSPYWKEGDRGVWEYEKWIDSFVSMDPEIEEQIRSSFTDFTGIVTIRDYAIPWVWDLHKQGFKVYYLSNYPERIEKECPEAIAFIQYMDGGILSYKDKVIKPDPEIYQLLMSRYHLIPDECVFFDDLQANIDGAIREGIHGIRFENKAQAEVALSKLCLELA